MPHRTGSYFHLHLVSDATGETLLTVARAAAAQFASVEPVEHMHPLVRTQKQLDRVLEELDDAPGIVLYTLLERELANRLEEKCRTLGLPCLSIMGPVLQLFHSYLGGETKPRVGAQHALDADYFKRIDALNFTMMHDDGQHTDDLEHADVVLVGISRTSKTPTSIYLANRGVKTANIPLVPGVAPPPNLETLKNPLVVGLTASLPLFDGFRRWNTYQTARTLAESGRLLLIGRRQQVLLDTALAYIAVLRDTRILAAREAQLAAIRRIAAFTEKQLELNDATRTDVALARSRVQEAEALRLRAQADLTASRLDFTRLTRMEPERMLPPRLPDGLPRHADAFAELVRRANPDIAAFQLEAEAAGYQAKAALADLLPKVDLRFSKIAQLGYSPVLDRITDTTTRVVATVPIYEPGTLPRIGEASALARQRGYEAQDKELATLTSARIAFARRQATAEQHAQLVARIGELRETMRGFAIERAAGFRTVLDELVVAPVSTVSSRATDTLITSRVKARFIEARRFQANHVKVVTEAGVTFLLGLVTEAEADAAVDIARGTAGVTRVVKVFETIKPN